MLQSTAAPIYGFPRIDLNVIELKTSKTALATAKQVIALDYGLQQIAALPKHNQWTDAFDVMCTFDILEHIENDFPAIGEWANWLNRGATLALSAPAHPQCWGTGDTWARHWRKHVRHPLAPPLKWYGITITRMACHEPALAHPITHKSMIHYKSTT
jgi:hypothetical protein